MDRNNSGVGVLDKAVSILATLESGPHSLAELVAAVGVDHPEEIRPFHIYRRISEVSVASFSELWPPPVAGSFINGDVDERYANSWACAQADRFGSG